MPGFDLKQFNLRAHVFIVRRHKCLHVKKCVHARCTNTRVHTYMLTCSYQLSALMSTFFLIDILIAKSKGFNIELNNCNKYFKMHFNESLGLTIRAMQIETKMRYYFTPTVMAIIRKLENNKCR